MSMDDILSAKKEKKPLTAAGTLPQPFDEATALIRIFYSAVVIAISNRTTLHLCNAIARRVLTALFS